MCVRSLPRVEDNADGRPLNEPSSVTAQLKAQACRLHNHCSVHGAGQPRLICVEQMPTTRHREFHAFSVARDRCQLTRKEFIPTWSSRKTRSKDASDKSGMQSLQAATSTECAVDTPQSRMLSASSGRATSQSSTRVDCSQMRRTSPELLAMHSKIRTSAGKHLKQRDRQQNRKRCTVRMIADVISKPTTSARRVTLAPMVNFPSRPLPILLPLEPPIIWRISTPHFEPRRGLW